MDHNNTFTSVGLQGGGAANGNTRKFANGYKTIGGTASYSNSTGVYFGTVVSALPSAPNDLLIGQSALTSPVRGVAIYEQNIAQNDPFKPNYALAGTPVTVLRNGWFALNTWTKLATSAVDPSIDAVVIYNKTTGAIEFQAYGTSAAPTGYVIADGSSPSVPKMKVVEVGLINGAGTGVLNTGSGVVISIEM